MVELTIWQTIGVSLISGTLSAALVCLFNLVIQDKKEKREAIRDFIRRWRKAGPAAVDPKHGHADMEMLSEIFVWFSNSEAVRERLQAYRNTEHFSVDFKALLEAMCDCAWVKYDEFLATSGKHG